MSTNDCTNLLNNAVNEINVLSCNQEIINNNIKVLQEEINVLTDEINDIKMGNDVFVGSIQNNATEIDYINNVSILEGENFTLSDTEDIRDGFLKVLINGNDNFYQPISLNTFTISTSTYNPNDGNIYMNINTTTITQNNSVVKTNINNIVSYNISNQTFNYLGTPLSNGANSTVSFVKYIPILDKIIVCGSFTSVSDLSGTKTANRIALWNPNSSSWELLGTPAQNGVTTASVFACDYYDDNVDKYIYIGGNFTQVSDISGLKSMNRVARWNLNTSRWEFLGVAGNNGIGNGQVNSIVCVRTGSINQVFFGGSFASATYSGPTTLTVNNVAIWNSNTIPNRWEYLGIVGSNGTNATVSNILQYNTDIYMTGNFTTASSTNGTISANFVVIWDTNTNNWAPLGLGFSNGFITGGSGSSMTLHNNNIYFNALAITAAADMISIKRTVSTGLTNYWKWDTTKHIWEPYSLFQSYGSVIINIDTNRLFISGNIVYPQKTVSVENNSILYSGIIYKNMKLIPKGANISLIWSQLMNSWILYGQLPNGVLLIQYI